MDSRAALHVGNIPAALERQGRIIGSYNLMIAAISRAQDLVLATSNIREFEQVVGLWVER